MNIAEHVRLNQTLKFFNVKSKPQQKVLSDAILRFDRYLGQATSFSLPLDQKGKTLCKIYKYFDSLNVDPTQN